MSRTNRMTMKFSDMVEVMEAVMGAAMEEGTVGGLVIAKAKAQELELPALSRYCCATSLIEIVC